MKIISILVAQAFRIFRPFGSFGYLPDAVKKTVDHFHFVDYPKEIAQLFPSDATQPITFRHGKVEIDGKSIILDWLQIYAAGIQVTTHTNTTDALVALDYVVDWGVREFHLTLEPVKSPGFWSQVNIRFERPLPELFPKLKPIAKTISEKHPDFLAFQPEFELGSIQFIYEAKANLNPVAFRIERATNINFAENMYLSDAPIATDDHIKILEDFERVCLES